jgi:hypothetical protein
MPVERCLVKETIVSDTNWIDDAMYNCNDNKDTVLPVNTRTFIGVTNINKRGNRNRKKVLIFVYLPVYLYQM